MTLRRCALPGALVALALFTSTPTTAQTAVGYPPQGGAYDLTSSVRLQVSPKEADVFVDGYYAGKVDEFDGTFQRLRVEPGEHEIQLFLPGHRLYTQKVYLQPGNTFKVRHTMERVAAGEAEPQRPIGDAPPRNSQRSAQPAPPRPDNREPGEQTGAVAIRVLPTDAVMMIDGQRWQGDNEEPLTVRLDTGRHTIDVRKSGYRGYLTEVTVEPGKTLTLNISLTPE